MYKYCIFWKKALIKTEKGMYSSKAYLYFTRLGTDKEGNRLYGYTFTPYKSTMLEDSVWFNSFEHPFLFDGKEDAENFAKSMSWLPGGWEIQKVNTETPLNTGKSHLFSKK